MIEEAVYGTMPLHSDPRGPEKTPDGGANRRIVVDDMNERLVHGLLGGVSHHTKSLIAQPHAGYCTMVQVERPRLRDDVGLYPGELAQAHELRERARLHL